MNTFKELFTEGTKGSSAQPIKAMIDVIKGFKKDEMNSRALDFYNELDNNALSEEGWMLFVRPGDYGEYYDDREKKGLMKKVLDNLKKALDKLSINYNATDAKKAYFRDAYERYGVNDNIIGLVSKLKKIGYNEFNNYRDAESFVNKFDVTGSFLIALRKENAETIMNLASSGIESINFEEIDNKEYISVGSRTSSFTEEYNVTVVEYGKSHKWSFNVSHTDIHRI